MQSNRGSDCRTSEILRTSEIAAAVSVHPNTVRLYEAWGYLPPIPRTASGYRQYNSDHLAQMQLARLAFADPFPGRALRHSLASVVRTAAQGDLDGAMDLACKHRLYVEDEIALAERAANYLEQWASEDPINLETESGLLAGEAAKEVAVTKETLRHWERSGLINPPRDPENGYRCFGQAEIGRLRVIRMLTRAGYSTMAVLRMVLQLDRGRKENLASMLEMPPTDIDVLHAADRWTITLHEHQQRSQAIIDHLESMRSAPAPARS